MSHVAILGKQSKDGSELATNLPGLSGVGAGRAHSRGGNHTANESGCVVSQFAQALHAEVVQIYNEAEREIAAAGPVCVASGKCCRFKEYGHTLFLSNIEADVLLSAAPPYATPVSDEFCPFQKNNLCTARELRPLGCRVYFCDPSYHETGNAITEKYLQKLKQLASQNDVPWEYAPLHVFLNRGLQKKEAGNDAS